MQWFMSKKDALSELFSWLIIIIVSFKLAPRGMRSFNLKVNSDAYLYKKPVMLVALFLTTVFGARPRPAPVLNIDREGISCAGISSGADFSVQFATAFSAHIMGVGVFAGQPFHCAATRFPLDEVFVSMLFVHAPL